MLTQPQLNDDDAKTVWLYIPGICATEFHEKHGSPNAFLLTPSEFTELHKAMDRVAIAETVDYTFKISRS